MTLPVDTIIFLTIIESKLLLFRVSALRMSPNFLKLISPIASSLSITIGFSLLLMSLSQHQVFLRGPI